MLQVDSARNGTNKLVEQLANEIINVQPVEIFSAIKLMQ